MTVREEKPDSAKGLYIDPELYGQPWTKSTEPIVRRHAEEAERNSTER
jgi:hypothetical protein